MTPSQRNYAKFKKKIAEINFFYLISQSLQFGKENKRQFIVFVVFFFFSSVLNALSPWAIAFAINHLIDKEMEKVLLAVLVYFGFRIAEQSCHYIARYIQRTLAFRVSAISFQMDILRKISSLPPSWQAKEHSGANIKIVQRASESLHYFIEVLSSGMFLAIFKLVFSLSLLFVLNVKVGLFIMLIILIAIAVVILFNKKLVKIYTRTFQWEDNLNIYILDGLTNIFTLAALDLTKRFFTRITEAIPTGLKLVKKKVLLSEIKWASGDVMGIIIVLTSFYLYYADIVSEEAVAGVGGFYVLLEYFSNIQGSLERFSGLYSNIVERAAAIRRVSTISQVYDRFISQKESRKQYEHIRDWKTVTIRNLEYYYSPNIGLKNIPFLKLYKGERIAVVGKSGSGKSTLLKILAGMYIAQKADVLADGNAYNFQALTEKCLLVPQDAEVFYDTVWKNIFMDMSAAEDKAQHILQMVCLKDFISGLPDGTETIIGEKGMNISGGEKQRIALARSLVFSQGKDILCLDECTSSVDGHIENEIYTQILHEMNDVTIIAAMHRMTSLKSFDRILVLDEGQLVGDGSFSALYKDCPIFKMLWEYFKTEHAQ